MIDRYYIGWVRDAKGNTVHRPRKEIANAMTTFTGGGIPDKRDGLGHTTPYVVNEYG